MYSIFDKKSLIYHPPQFCHNTGHALRHFQSQLNSNQKTVMSDYPEDFDIYEVGSYNDQSGEIEPSKKPQHVCNMAELLDNKPKDEVSNEG